MSRQPSALAMSTARLERSMAYLRSAALLEVKPPSMVSGCSQRRGAMNSQNSPSPSSIFLTLATPFCVSAGVEVGGDDVVVVELHAVEAELLVFADLGGEGDFLADRRAERIGAGADVPGAEGEAVAARLGKSHSSFLLVGADESEYCSRRPPPGDSTRDCVVRSHASSGCIVDRVTIKCASCGQELAARCPVFALRTTSRGVVSLPALRQLTRCAATSRATSSRPGHTGTRHGEPRTLRATP